MTEHSTDLRYLTSISPIHPEMSSLEVLFFNHTDNCTGSGEVKKILTKKKNYEDNRIATFYFYYSVIQSMRIVDACTRIVSEEYIKVIISASNPIVF